MTYMACVPLVLCNTLTMQAMCYADAGILTLTVFRLSIMCARIGTVTLTVCILA